MSTGTMGFLTNLVVSYGWRRILYTASVIGITVIVALIVRLNKRRQVALLCSNTSD